jgi:hypothetical protein
VEAHVEGADAHATVEGGGLQRECCLKSPWYPQNSWDMGVRNSKQVMPKLLGTSKLALEVAAAHCSCSNSARQQARQH